MKRENRMKYIMLFISIVLVPIIAYSSETRFGKVTGGGVSEQDIADYINSNSAILSIGDSLWAHNTDTTNNYLMRVSKNGVTKAYIDSTGLLVTNSVQSPSFYTTTATKWQLPINRFSTIYSDSVTSAGVAIDTSMAREDWVQYYSVITVTSPSSKTVIVGQTFLPVVQNPDSITFDVYGTQSAVLDSASILVVVKDKSTVITSTGWFKVTTASTWEHIAFPILSDFTLNSQYKCIVYMKARSGGRWCFSPISFK